MNDIAKPSRSRVTLIIDIVEDDGQWRVRLCRNVYSEHKDKEGARRQASELATEGPAARPLSGGQVEIWDRTARATRLL